MRALRLGFKRIIVFPYFLFTGVLVKRIYAAADAIAAVHPDVEIVKAPYLNDHPRVLDAFAERAAECETGGNKMNCRLCKYRTQVIGYADEVAKPQVGHHLHVRGIGTDGAHHHHHDGHAHDHDHDHPHDHGHDHEHHHHHHMRRSGRTARCRMRRRCGTALTPTLSRKRERGSEERARSEPSPEGGSLRSTLGRGQGEGRAASADT